MHDFYSITESAATRLLMETKWPGGNPVCPKCGSSHNYKIKTRPAFSCKECGRQHTLLSGTPFENSKLSKAQIVRAILLYEASKGKIRNGEMAAELGVTYKVGLIMKRKCWEATMLPAGPLSERASPISRGYWQGYNFFFSRAGKIWRANKHGDEKPA